MASIKVRIGNRWVTVGGGSENTSTSISKEEIKNDVLSQVQEVINGVKTDVSELEDYLDLAFRDGVMSEVEVAKLKTYLNLILSSYTVLVAKYEDIYANTYLTEARKIGLEASKENLDQKYAQLVQSINDAISDRTVTNTEDTIVDDSFDNFNNALNTLTHMLEQASKEIWEKMQEEAEGNSNAYTDTLRDSINVEINRLDSTVTTLRGDLTDAEDYINTSFKDGIISVTEANTIKAYLNSLGYSYDGVIAQFNVIYNNDYLTTEERNSLASDKNALDLAYNELRAVINNAIGDNQATEEEKLAVDTAFTSFNVALSNFYNALSVALNNIMKAIGDEAYGNAKEYTDNEMARISDIVRTVEVEVSQTKDSIKNRVTYAEMNNYFSKNTLSDSTWLEEAENDLNMDYNTTAEATDYLQSILDGIDAVNENGDKVLYSGDLTNIQDAIENLEIRYDLLEERYMIINAMEELANTTEDENMDDAQADMQLAHTNLLTLLNDIIKDELITESEQTILPILFDSYNEVLDYFFATMDSALIKVAEVKMQAQIDEAEEYVKLYSESLEQYVSNIQETNEQAKYDITAHLVYNTSLGTTAIEHIRSYQESINGQYIQLLDLIDEILANEYLVDGTGKVELQSRRVELTSTYTQLNESIEEIVTAPSSTPALRRDFEVAMSLYNNAVTNVHRASKIALDELKNGKISGVDSIAEYYAELKKQEAEKYADDLKEVVDESINDVSESLNNTTMDITAIHSSSAMQEIMRVQLAQYLRTLANTRSEVTQVYDIVVANEDVPPSSLTTLATLKDNMDASYSEITEGINGLLGEGVLIEINDYNLVTEDLQNFREHVSNLSNELYNCLAEVQETQEQEYTEEKMTALTEGLNTLETLVTDQRSTLESQKEGTVITESELTNLNSLLDTVNTNYQAFIENYTTAMGLSSTLVNSADVTNAQTIYTTVNEVATGVNANRINAGTSYNFDNMQAYTDKLLNYRAVISSLKNTLDSLFGNHGVNISSRNNTYYNNVYVPKDQALLSIGGFYNPIQNDYNEAVTLDKGGTYLESNLALSFATALSNLQDTNTNLVTAYNELQTLNSTFTDAITNEQLTAVETAKTNWDTLYVQIIPMLNDYSAYTTVNNFVNGIYEDTTELYNLGINYITEIENTVNSASTVLNTYYTDIVNAYISNLEADYNALDNAIRECNTEVSTISSNCYVPRAIIDLLNEYSTNISSQLNALALTVDSIATNENLTSELRSALNLASAELNTAVTNNVNKVIDIAKDNLVYESELSTDYENLLTTYNEKKTALETAYTNAVNHLVTIEVSNNIQAIKTILDKILTTFDSDIENTIESLSALLDNSVVIKSQLEQLKTYLATLSIMYSDLEARYNQIFHNSYLSLEFANKLEEAKVLLEETYNNLNERITTAIENNSISDEEMQTINYSISDFNVQVERMSGLLIEGIDIIENNKIKNIKVGGRNLLLNSTFHSGVWADSYTVESEGEEVEDEETTTFQEIDVVENVDYSNMASIYKWGVHSNAKKEIHVNTIHVSGVDTFSGIYQTLDELGVKPNTNYVLSFDIRKTGGTLGGVGGHVDSSIASAYFMRVDNLTSGMSGGYNSSYTNQTLFNDGNWHRVIVGIVTGSTITTGHRIYIQPNRGSATAYEVDITNIQVTEADYYSKYALSFKDNTTIMTPDCRYYDDRLTMTEWVKNEDNSVVLSRVGLAEEKLDIMESNRFDVKETDKKLSFSLNIKATNYEDYDEQTVFWVQFYHNGNVVQRRYITIADMGLETMKEEAWYRIGYTLEIGNSEDLDIFSKESPNSGSLTIMGTKNGTIEIKEVQAEVGDRYTEWQLAPEDTYSMIVELSGRVSNTEQIVTDSSIVDIVTSSYTFSTYFNGLATTDDLAGYETKENVQNEIDALRDETNKKFDALDYVTEYTVQSMLTRTDAEITARFKNAGGINLVRNSVGFAGTDFWTLPITNTGEISIEQGMSDLTDLGSGSAFCLEGACKMTQTINKWYGDYVMHCYFYSNDPDASIRITCRSGEKVEGTSEEITYQGILENSGSTNGQWIKKSVPMNDDERSADITIENISGTTYVTCLAVHLGKDDLLWTTAPDEIYNSAVQMSSSGIRVVSSGVGDYVAITPQEFSGYSVVADEETGALITEKVFTLNKDVTEVSKLYAKKDIQVGTMKLVPVRTNQRTGIAFIPVNEE